MPDENKIQKIIESINCKKVLSFENIAEEIGNSFRTAQRYLKRLNGLTSYTHRGKFVTLPTIAQFDNNGLWHFNSIGFSKFGSSLDSILELITRSENGVTKEELENILKIKIPRQMQILLEQKKLYRLKLGNKYLYLAKNVMENRVEKIKIVANRQTEEYHKKKLEITDVIAVLNVVLVENKIDMNNLKQLIQKHELSLPVLKLEKLIVKYNLTKKKRH